MNQLIIEHADNGVTLALLEDGQLVEYSRYTNDAGIQPEQIYLGRVDRVVTGLQAAFITIGKDVSGFLPLAEAAGGKTGALHSGDRLMVQVKKPPTQSKAAFLTREISLAGRYVILLPFSPSHGVSHRVMDPQLRAAMMSRAKSLAPAGMSLVMRSESINANDDAVMAEINRLVNTWEHVIAEYTIASSPALIWQGDSPVERMFRDLSALPDMVICNDASRLPPSLPCPHTMAQTPLLLHNVQKKLEKSLKRHIFLKSGGTIVIDVCEAMTVIDVNTGKYTGGKSSLPDTIMKTNCEAACEAARILRLRKLSGIIIFDFIDMESEESRSRVKAVLADALSRDRIKTVVHGFTTLGLLEMTRKKTEHPLDGVQETVCPCCKGTGILQEKDDAALG